MADDLEVAGHELEHLRDVSIQVAQPTTAIRALAAVLDRWVRMNDCLARQVGWQGTPARAAANTLRLSGGRRVLSGGVRRRGCRLRGAILQRLKAHLKLRDLELQLLA